MHINHPINKLAHVKAKLLISCINRPINQLAHVKAKLLISCINHPINNLAHVKAKLFPLNSRTMKPIITVRPDVLRVLTAILSS